MVGSRSHTHSRSNVAQTIGDDSNPHSVEIVLELVNADHDNQLMQPTPETQIPTTNIFSSIQAMLESSQPPPNNRPSLNNA
ncbi:hypothetical protein P8452_09704 [Trifolium repens]|nr:hypothetical protein P8452_09704 [Trifolium repens]